MDGVVNKAVVLSVLEAHGVAVIHLEDGTVLLIKGDIIECQVMPDKVHRRMLHRLQSKFDVPIHRFFHPA